MIKVSDAYLSAIKEYTREFDNTVTIFNGVDKKEYKGCEVKINEIFSENNEAMSIGRAFSQKVELKIFQPEFPFNYSDGKIVITSGLMVDGKLVEVPLGTYYTSEVKTNDNYFTMSITGYDRMTELFQKKYIPKVTLPTTDTAIIEDICTQYNLENNTKPLNRAVDKIFEGTVAETLGHMAGLQGKNAIFNRYGKLIFRGYPDIITYQELEAHLYESFYPYTYNEIQYNNIEWLKRGDTDEYDMDVSEQKENGITVSAENMIKIESVTSGTKDNVMTAGNGRGITFINPYITQDELEYIYNIYKGITYYSGAISTFGNPIVEVGDMIYTKDNADKAIIFLVSSQILNVGSGFSSRITSSGSGDTKINFDNIKSPSEQKLETTKTELQEAIAKNSSLINGANGGVYKILDINNDGINDGWSIANSSNPEEVDKFIVANYEGIGFSNDGDTVYEQAITHEGINATAITTGELNADLIKAGTLSSRDGESFNLNLDSGDLKINMKGENAFQQNIFNVHNDADGQIMYANPYYVRLHNDNTGYDCHMNVNDKISEIYTAKTNTRAKNWTELAALNVHTDRSNLYIQSTSPDGELLSNSVIQTDDFGSSFSLGSVGFDLHISCEENYAEIYLHKGGPQDNKYISMSADNDSATFTMGASSEHYLEIVCTQDNPTRIIMDGRQIK